MVPLKALSELDCNVDNFVFYCGFSTKVTCAFPRQENIESSTKKSLLNLEKLQYLSHCLSNKAFKGTVVNRALASL